MKLKRKEVLLKTVPSIVIFTAAFILLYLKVDALDLFASFMSAWWIAGLIWGWTLTKRFFPNFRLFGGGPQLSRSQEEARQAARASGVPTLGAHEMSEVIHGLGKFIRILCAFIVGIVALPIGIIITIIILIGIGSDASKKRKAAEAEAKANQETEEKVNQEATQIAAEQETNQENNN